MSKYLKYLAIGLLINFGGLALGSAWTDPGVASEWYAELDKAPWTPPGWVFAAAWTTIGLTFSMWYAYVKVNGKEDEEDLMALFPLSVVLNVIWNPLFFAAHQLFLAWIVITFLGVTIYYIADITRREYGWKPMLLVLPYFVWICVANSLNLYAAIMHLV
jgi:benzodiazapine receptor